MQGGVPSPFPLPIFESQKKTDPNKHGAPVSNKTLILEIAPQGHRVVRRALKIKRKIQDHMPYHACNTQSPQSVVVSRRRGHGRPGRRARPRPAATVGLGRAGLRLRWVATAVAACVRLRLLAQRLRPRKARPLLAGRAAWGVCPTSEPATMWGVGVQCFLQIISVGRLITSPGARYF